MNERIEVNTLQEKLTEFLNNIGISGPAEITEDTENNTYTVKIDNYKFFGFYPSTDNSLFTLQVVRGDKELPSGMFVDSKHLYSSPKIFYRISLSFMSIHKCRLYI